MHAQYDSRSEIRGLVLIRVLNRPFLPFTFICNHLYCFIDFIEVIKLRRHCQNFSELLFGGFARIGLLEASSNSRRNCPIIYDCRCTALRSPVLPIPPARCFLVLIRNPFLKYFFLKHLRGSILLSRTVFEYFSFLLMSLFNHGLVSGQADI